MNSRIHSCGFKQLTLVAAILTAARVRRGCAASTLVKIAVSKACFSQSLLRNVMNHLRSNQCNGRINVFHRNALLLQALLRV